jgi:hypothetical protein
MNIEPYLNLIIGTIFIFILGFFILQIVLAAITLATGFEGSKKAYETATKQLTGALKGLLLALVTYFLLNTILQVFGISTSSENITKTLSDYFGTFMGCLRDFSTCAN